MLQCGVTYHAFIPPPTVLLPTQPTDTLRVSVAAEEMLQEEEGEQVAGAVEHEGKEEENQAGIRDETEPSCLDQEEGSATQNGGHDPRELNSSRHRIPCSQRCPASNGI